MKYEKICTFLVFASVVLLLLSHPTLVGAQDEDAITDDDSRTDAEKKVEKFMKEKKWVDADTLLIKLFESTPDRIKRADYLFKRAKCKRTQPEYAVALKILDNALKENPFYMEVYFEKARIYAKQQDLNPKERDRLVRDALVLAASEFKVLKAAKGIVELKPYLEDDLDFVFKFILQAEKFDFDARGIRDPFHCPLKIPTRITAVDPRIKKRLTEKEQRMYVADAKKQLAILREAIENGNDKAAALAMVRFQKAIKIHPRIDNSILNKEMLGYRNEFESSVIQIPLEKIKHDIMVLEGKVVIRKMHRAFKKGRHKEVQALFNQLKDLTDVMIRESVYGRGPARQLQLLGDVIYQRSLIVQKFEAIPLEVSGVIKREEKRPLAVINNYILEEEEITPFNRELQVVKIDVQKQIVYFNYRGERVSKKLKESAKK